MSPSTMPHCSHPEQEDHGLLSPLLRVVLDRIQKQTQGYVVADAFTHGSSEQRVRWFMYGLKEGDPKLMDRAFEVDTP